MAYKITVFYNQFGQGWTETFYTLAAMTPSSFNFPAFQKWLNTSILFRAQGVSIYGARYTQIGSSRVNYSQLFGGTYLGSANQPSIAPSSLDWCVKLLGVNNQYRHIFIRGLDTGDIERNATTGESVANATLQKLMNQYMQAAAALGLCLQTEQNFTTNPGLFEAPVISVAPSGTNPEQSVVTLAIAPAFGGTAPFFLRFGKVPRNDIPGFPRECQVLATSGVSPFSVTIPYRYRASSATVFPANMTATQLLYNYPQVVSPTSGFPGWFSVSFQERKTGRAFGVPRGRSRVVVSRR